MKTKAVILFLVILASVTAVTADFDRLTSYDWLENKSHGMLTIEEMSYTTLALNNANRNVNTLIQNINAEKDTLQGCWPNAACNVKDTSLAYLALKTTGQNTADIEEYLTQPSTLIPGVTSGEWRIQIEAPSNGTCMISWNEGIDTKEFQVQGNQISPTAQQYFINIAQDLDANLVNSQTGAKVEVDCSQLSGSIIISLIYKKSNNIYILQNIQSARATEANALTIENGCYGQTASATSCDYESTLTATWAQVEAGKDLSEIGTQTYLESSLSNNELHRGMLARTLTSAGQVKTIYFNQMQQSQTQDGSWSAGDVLTTAFSVFALQGATGYTDTMSLALEYLNRVAANDGSWNQGVLDTSIALIALEGARFTQTVIDTTEIPPTVEICDDGIDNDNDGYDDCGDADCSTFFMCDTCNDGVFNENEEGIDCGGPCAECETSSGQEEICYDGLDDDNDGFTDCDDYDCEFDDACVSGVEYEPTETQDEKSYTWVWILLLLLLLGGGGFFFYTKYIKTGKIDPRDLKSMFKKKKKVQKPTFQQFVKQKQYKPQPAQRRPQQKARPQQRRARSKEDEELDKSLREAEKLLKG